MIVLAATKKNALTSCYQQQANAFRSRDIITNLHKFIISRLLFFVNSQSKQKELLKITDLRKEALSYDKS